ncbi:MAG: NAD(P)-binding domain-containing protein [Bacteroidota bacterium]
MKVGFIGNGNVAKKLGSLMESTNYQVSYGTRGDDKNEKSISEIIKDNEVILLAIPYGAVESVIKNYGELLNGKTVIDITNPINIENWKPIFMGESSAGEKLSDLLPNSHIVKAFNSIFADVMDRNKLEFNGQKLTAFIASDNEQSANLVKKIADDIGFQGFIVGGIQNARYLESLANLNIAIALSGGGTEAGFAYHQREA